VTSPFRPGVWQKVARVQENAFVGRVNDETSARLELPVLHYMAWDGEAERTTFPPDAYGEARD
jgi:hypothetical protein